MGKILEASFTILLGTPGTLKQCLDENPSLWVTQNPEPLAFYLALDAWQSWLDRIASDSERPTETTGRRYVATLPQPLGGWQLMRFASFSGIREY